MFHRRIANGSLGVAAAVLAACSSPIVPDGGGTDARAADADATTAPDAPGADSSGGRDVQTGNDVPSSIDVQTPDDVQTANDVPPVMDVPPPPDAGPCPQDFADCDRNPANGCETHLGTTVNCGACGDRCGPSQFCFNVGGPGNFTCSSDCPAPNTMCPGSCSDLQSDPQHCGNCDTVCSAPSGGTGSCVGGMCQAGCSAGQHNCNSVCVSNADTAHCGGSCTPCATVANASATCDGNSCGLSCNPGFANCNATPGDGCEADLNSDSNCGACGTVCSLYKGCAGAACSWQRMVDAVNRVRAMPQNCGGTMVPAAPALTLYPALQDQALFYASDLAAHNASIAQINYTASDGSTTGTRINRAGLSRGYEVAGTGDLTETPDALVGDLIAAAPSICVQFMSSNYSKMGFAAAAGTMYPAYLDFMLGGP